MKTPPSLLSLTIDTAVHHLSAFSDLPPLPEHIALDLFVRTIQAQKLTGKLLKLFIATGNDKVLSMIQTLEIRPVHTPVLPTMEMLAAFWRLHKLLVLDYLVWKMYQDTVKDTDVDIVIGALHSDLTSFMNEWKPIFSRFHLIIVKDPGLTEELTIPEGFNLDVYDKARIEKVVGPSASVLFSGYLCRYFGFLVSRKKYIISIDDDCTPTKDSKGFLVDAVAQHVTNLSTPATPFFFNTLYDPYREGADFVRGYPFSLRNGVTCALSCGLWLNLADLDAPTQALKPDQRNSHYVDAVLTVPARTMMPVSGINIAFDREVVGPALVPGLRLSGEGKVRWETMEDIWSGMCAKVVCDHLGVGVKSGIPYVWRKDRGNAVESLKKEWEGVKMMEEVVPFFQSLRLSQAATTAEECVMEMATKVKENLGPSHPVFAHAAEAMVQWVKLWKTVGSGSLPSIA